MSAAITTIAVRSAVALGVLALVIALMMLVGKPVGITFAQVNLNLTVDSEASYNGNPVPAATWDLKDLVPGVDKFFNFSDIKPGDSGENTISLHVDRNAWICLEFKNLTQQENGENEPESHVDNTSGGDLAAGTEVFAWRDDGDNIFEPQSGETKLFGVGSAATLFANKTYAIADALNTPAVPANQTKYFGIAWCAGDLVVNMGNGTMTCNGEALGNIAQTDSFSVDISLSAANAVDEPQFTCSGEKPPKPRDQGLGETIGLFVKCQTIAKFGWPLPKYETECPNGFGRNPSTSSVQTTQTQTQSTRDRGTRR